MSPHPRAHSHPTSRPLGTVTAMPTSPATSAQDTPRLRRGSGAVRQNGMGDVVVPVANGEIVALPRLWGFDLTELTADTGVLRTDTGLIAVVTFEGDTAIVADVTDVRRSA